MSLLVGLPLTLFRLLGSFLLLALRFAVPILLIAAVCALLLAACLPFAFAEGTASAEGGVQAVTATAYGSLDTDDLWYFAEGELDLDGLKAYVEKSILPVLRANSVEPVVIAVVDTGLDRNNSLFAAGEHGSELLLRDTDQNLLGYKHYPDDIVRDGFPLRQHDDVRSVAVFEMQPQIARRGDAEGKFVVLQIVFAGKHRESADEIFVRRFGFLAAHFTAL